MKRSILIFMLLAFFGLTKAQDIRESFETWPPEGWTLVRAFGAKGDWQQSDLSEAGAPAAAVDGTHAAMVNFANLPFVRLDMITPERDFSTYANAELSFCYYHEGKVKDNSRLEVYVSYEKDSFELFEVVPTNFLTEDWVTYKRVLDSRVRQVRLRGIKDISVCIDPLYVDQFSIGEGPQCAYPYSLATSLVPGQDGHVRFQWKSVAGTKAWRIKISSKAIEPATEAADIVTEDVEAAEYVAENLEVGKTYYWYVQGRSGETGSEWIAGRSVTVAKSPLVVPFLLDFEADNGDFVAIQENQVNGWYWGDKPYEREENRCHFISNDGGETFQYEGSQDSRSYIWRDIAFPADGDHGFELAFDFKGMGSYPNHAMAIYITEDLDYYPEAGSFVNNLKARQVCKLATSLEWSRRKVELSAAYAGKTVRLIIGWQNNTYEKVVNPPAAIDNLSVDKLVCPLPKQVQMVANSLNTITLMWDTVAGVTKKWEIEYGEYNFEIGTGTVVTVEQYPPFTVTDLDTCAFYDFVVRAQCDGGEEAVWSEPSERLHAQTACPARTAPYFENFDALEREQYPLGWSYVTNDSTYAPYVLAHDFYAYSQPNGMMMNTVLGNTRMGMISPEFTDLGQQDKRVRFYARLSMPVTLEVGVMKSPTDTASYIVLSKFSGGDFPEYDEQGRVGAGMFRHTVYLDDPRITDEYKHVCLRMANAAPMEVGSVDDFLYETIPSCIEPVNLRLVDVSTNSIRLQWDAQGSETRWEVICGEGSFVPDNDTAGMPVTETTATIGQLAKGTFYRAYVRAVCSETEKGPWSDAYLFKTCSDGTLPLMENFDMAKGFDIPLCWAVRDAESLWKIQQTQSYSAPYAMVYPTNKPKINDWLFTPGLPLTAGTNYRITFRAKKILDKAAVLRIFYGQTPDAAGMTEAVAVVDSLSTDYTMVRGYFTPKATGIYHIGLNYESAVSSGLALDDVGVMASVGIEKEAAVETFRLYPNPADDRLYIDLGQTETAAVAIFGMNGMMLRYIPVYQSGSAISIQDLPSGAYVVRIAGKGHTSVHKIMVR